jgi:exosortase B
MSSLPPVSMSAKPAGSKRDDLIPEHSDKVLLAMLAAGLALLYLPTFMGLASTIWSRDEQGHGPIILAVATWLLFRQRQALAELPAAPAPGAGWPLFVLAMLMYAIGRSQAVLFLEVGSEIPLLASMLLLFKGRRGLRMCWFPLFFLLFMVPLPMTLVAAVTTPLKTAVSAVASQLLYDFGYPVGRAGVIITVGQYQLLVADACAGLNSMFTLEALGLLYMNIMNYTSARRNIFLALAIIPISFCANIIRVMILVLVTYHFGDEAGQGFVHGFAGMVLFLVALTMILTLDGAISFVLRMRQRKLAT